MQTASSSSAQQSQSGSGSVPYPPMPGSPTLTNPDMILPDYDDTASSPDRSQSPLMLWKNAHAADMQFDLSSQPFPSGHITPTTPIIYGNGTMLSDIGEVTEAESTCPPRRSRAASTLNEYSMRLSPTMPYDATRTKEFKASRERRMSMESTSTITTHEQPGLFADFDDVVSVDDSNFQGDDEESVADSYIDDASMQESISPVREIPKGFGEERDSTALSRRAEQILANAKRRLTTMEGNLSRARTSISSPTISSFGSDSTPSPPIVRPITAIHRDHDSDARKRSHGHTRISSENNLSTEFRLSDVYAQRSSSAMGAAGGYRQPLQSSRSVDHMHERTRSSPKGNSIYGNSSFAKSKPSLHVRDHVLEPLSEDEVSEDLNAPMPSIEEAKLDSFLSPTFGSYSDKGLKRSASTAQMRDIKDQMQGLKGRLSTLRDQARADSMKRRSLQSLRTPSPFTHARVDQWYADANGHTDGKSILTEHDGQPHPHGVVLDVDDGDSAPVGTPRISEEDEDEDDGFPVSGYTDADESAPPTKLSPSGSRLHLPEKHAPEALDQYEEEMEEEEDMKTEDGYDDAEPNDVNDEGSESGESSYHDSVQNQLSHEDREDAFDYEHFFLHSAMGSMTRRRNRRGSHDGYTSEESVETTKGPVASTKPRSAARAGRSRRGSAGSTSTTDSFATATEGDSEVADDDVLEDYDDQVVTVRQHARTHTPETAKRPTFDAGARNSGSDGSQSQASGIRRPQSSSAAFMHRPSVSSIESSGTHRSFPLVNRPKMNGGVLTPRDSPDQELKRISETLMSETASLCDRESIYDGESMAPMEALEREDQILVQSLVASLGRCVLGLTESGRAGTQSQSYRRRIEAARQILEGMSEAGTV